MKEFGIEPSTLVGFTSDGASVIVAAGRKLGSSSQWSLHFFYFFLVQIWTCYEKRGTVPVPISRETFYLVSKFHRMSYNYKPQKASESDSYWPICITISAHGVHLTIMDVMYKKPDEQELDLVSEDSDKEDEEDPDAECDEGFVLETKCH